MNPSNSPTPERIMQLGWAYAPPLCIEAAVKNKVFDSLDDGPLTVEQIATKTGASLRGLTAILNVLVNFDLLRKEGAAYALTPESSAFLVAGKPGYHGMFFQHLGDQLIPKWLQLTEVVRSGKPALEVNNERQGAAFFAEFVEAIFPLSFGAANALGVHLGVPAATQPISVLDIGSGSGVWGIALAKQSPQVHIWAVDWSNVLEVTQKVAAQHGVADRLTTAPGDFSTADFGSGHQICTVGHILHSEGRERSQSLLKKIFAALAPGGTIAVQEFVLNDDRTGPPAPVIFAVNMLVNTSEGDAFTFPEMAAWLKEAGFVNPRQIDVPAVSPLILATKPQ